LDTLRREKPSVSMSLNNAVKANDVLRVRQSLVNGENANQAAAPLRC